MSKKTETVEEPIFGPGFENGDTEFDEDNEEYEENPAPMTLEDRIESLERQNTALQEQVKDATSELKVLVADMKESYQKPIVVDSAPNPHDGNILAFDKLVSVQAKAMEPMNKLAENFFKMGAMFGRIEVESEVDRERADTAEEQMTTMKKQVMEIQARPPQDVSKILEQATPIAEKLIEILQKAVSKPKE